MGLTSNTNAKSVTSHGDAQASTGAQILRMLVDHHNAMCRTIGITGQVITDEAFGPLLNSIREV